MLALIHVCVNPVTTIEAVPVDGWGRTDGLCQANSARKRAPSALVHCSLVNVGVN